MSVCHFSAAEADRDLDSVAVGKELIKLVTESRQAIDYTF